jgi:predicted nucleic acid-binding protein
MTYLLDTNAISDLMRAAPRIENWMAGLDEDDRVVTCTIVSGRGSFWDWQAAGGQTAY